MQRAACCTGKLEIPKGIVGIIYVKNCKRTSPFAIDITPRYSFHYIYIRVKEKIKFLREKKNRNTAYYKKFRNKRIIPRDDSENFTQPSYTTKKERRKKTFYYLTALGL